MQKQLAGARDTVVHCSSGKDRTGLFLAYHSMREGGLSPEAAIEEARRVRPIALTAPGRHELALQVLGRIS